VHLLRTDLSLENSAFTFAFFMRGRLTFSLTAAASASQSLRRVGILLDHHSENLALITKFRCCFQMMHFDAQKSLPHQ